MSYYETMSFPKRAFIGVTFLFLGGVFIFFYFQKPSVETLNTPTQESQKEKFIFISLGDSLTAGYEINPDHAFSYLIEQKLNQDFPNFHTQVINAGINGSTTSSALNRLQSYLSLKPQVVFIALGSNDGLRGTPLEVIEKNLRDTIQLAQTNNIRVLLAGMKLPLNYGEDYRIPFEKIFENLAQQHKIKYVPFLLEGVATLPEYNLSDGIHPNEKGHQIIKQTLYPYFKSFYP